MGSSRHLVTSEAGCLAGLSKIIFYCFNSWRRKQKLFIFVFARPGSSWYSRYKNEIKNNVTRLGDLLPFWATLLKTVALLGHFKKGSKSFIFLVCFANFLGNSLWNWATFYSNLHFTLWRVSPKLLQYKHEHFPNLLESLTQCYWSSPSMT